MEKQKTYVLWNVAGEDHKVKLNTRTIVLLEEKLDKSLMDLIVNMDELLNGEDPKAKLPSLGDMMIVLYGGLHFVDNSITIDDTYELFDKYVEEDEGSVIKLFSDVFMPLLLASGIMGSGENKTPKKQVTKAPAKKTQEI